jgi:hypothetical protein
MQIFWVLRTRSVQKKQCYFSHSLDFFLRAIFKNLGTKIQEQSYKNLGTKISKIQKK